MNIAVEPAAPTISCGLILIAEDSPTQAQQLEHILQQRGYQVAVAPNGRRALEMARVLHPALVISDVVMPEMDGYELCSRIKSDERLAGVPVILVTTLSDPHDVINGLECRADNFILKPYDEKYLLGRIQFVLVNREMRQSEQPGMGLEIFFNGQRHFITADRLQILNLLLSTYDAAIQRNRELTSMQSMLRQTNAELQRLTHELEDRVRERTRELELANVALLKANEDLRRTQQAAMQQERLKALGQMASGIAHDINNAISPVALYTESLLEHERQLSGRGREQLTIVQRAINDVAQTVARMREFYRPREAQQAFREMDINHLVQQVLDLTRARWSDQPQKRGITVDLRVELALEIPVIEGADSEIRDALTNLVFNAMDAMPEGGTLTVRTGESAASAVAGARVAFLEVCDSGVGMDEATRRRCLEPFFTTKGERGTGLGLPMVYGMAQRHGAVMEIDTEPGSGTCVRLLFPVRTHAPIAATGQFRSLRPQRSLRLLLVDDEPVLLATLRDVLSADGHVVQCASGGQAGIDAFLEALAGAEPFDAVITDLGMPHVDGRQVARRIRDASPKTPIIVLTGWGQLPAAGDEQDTDVDRLLGKPPRLNELREALAQCCEEPC